MPFPAPPSGGRKTLFPTFSLSDVFSLLSPVRDDFAVFLEGFSLRAFSARAVFFLDILHNELGFTDASLEGFLRDWKGKRGWTGRPWEGPVV